MENQAVETVQASNNLIQTVDDRTIKEALELVGVKIPEHEVRRVVSVCKALNLNPFLKEVHFIPYKNKETEEINLTLITSYDVMIKRAEASGKLAWWNSGSTKEDNELVGFVKIKRKDWDDVFIHTVYFSEYNQGNHMWRTKPRYMIEKVAIGQGFRRCFAAELGGMPSTEIPQPEIIEPTESENFKTIKFVLESGKYQTVSDVDIQVSTISHDIDNLSDPEKKEAWKIIERIKIGLHEEIQIPAPETTGEVNLKALGIEMTRFKKVKGYDSVDRWLANNHERIFSTYDKPTADAIIDEANQHRSTFAPQE